MNALLEPHAAVGTPSPWVTRWAAWLPSGSTVLDLACGSGRHLRWLATRGLRVTGMDRDAQALQGLNDVPTPAGPAELLTAVNQHGPVPL